MANYVYSNVSDFLNANNIILGQLQEQIENSAITSATILYCLEIGDSITIYFDNSLSVGDEAILTGIVNTYTTEALEDIVTTSGDFTLTNKDLITDTNFFIDPLISTKRLGFDTSLSTNDTTLTLQSTTTSDRTITFPDITDTLITLTATQNLSNKTFDTTIFDGQGNTNATNSTIYINPESTAITGSNNYYFTNLTQPITTGSTTGSAYTFYIENEPSGTITNSYAFYIENGSSYFGGNTEFIGSSTFNALGQTIPSLSTMYINSSTTTISDPNNYYWSYFSIPVTTGSTTGEAYTIYIEGAPSGTITSPYALYIADGRTYLGGEIEIPSNSDNGKVLTSDANGTATWQFPAIVSSFADGTEALPGISFSNETSTGFYRLAANQLGISIGGTLGFLIKDTGADITNGSIFNIGTSGTTSSLNVFGAITGSDGITISSGLSDVQALTAAGLLTANGGINVPNGETVNIGSSGITSFLNVFGTFDVKNRAIFENSGNIDPNLSVIYVKPVSTTISDPNNYYWSYFSIPVTTGSTTGEAYTIYIEGAPSGTITSPYALYIADGRTYLGGEIEIPTGASNGLVLTSDANGLATWQSPAIVSTFSDGTEALPGISFSNETATGFYRPVANQLGISIGGTLGFLIKDTGADITNGSIFNIGTSGTTSSLNVFGAITGSDGITISSGLSDVQALTAAGLLTANAGVTIPSGQTLTSAGIFNSTGQATFSKQGHILPENSAVYVNPTDTSTTGSSDYYWTYLATPNTTGGTTGKGYTLYIEGEPTGFFGAKYSLYVDSGNVYLGGVLQFASGATDGYVLKSDSQGFATWTDISTLGTTFSDGSVSSPSITFTDELTTGFYRPTTNQIGIAIAGSSECIISTGLFNITTGNTLNVGLSGTSSNLNVFGEITGYNGLTINAGLTQLKDLDIIGNIDIDGQLNILDSNIVNIGLSGTSSLLNVYGEVNIYGNTHILEPGNIDKLNTTLYVAPGNTPISGSNTYFFTYFEQPITTGITTGSSYTIYIEGEPLGNITNKYAFYVNSGISYFNGDIQIPNGASDGFLLKSDANGIVSWVSPALLGTTFPDGTASLPGIAFTSELGTGFYRTGTGSIGVELSGSNYITFNTTSTDWINDSVVNVGTSGATSTLNVYGDVTTSGNTDLQTLTTQGLHTANAGITLANGQVLNVGTSGLSSSILIKGSQITDGIAVFNGDGNPSAAGATIYVNPDTTNLSGASNYFFTNFTAPFTTGTTTGDAYTVYIGGEPSGTIANPYAFFIATGKTYIGGALQIPNGAVEDYVLTSDGNGNASWGAPTIASTFLDGTEASVGIGFTAEPGTGFYRPSAGAIGISLQGTNHYTLSTSAFNLINGIISNFGTSGTTNPLNVYGAINGTNGLTISSGNTQLQTITTLGLISADAGITISNGNVLNVGTSSTTSSLNVFGSIAGNNGLTISSGLTTLQNLTTDGLYIANAGITISNGNTLNVGTSSTISSLNVYGLITGNNGLTISAGDTSLTTLQTSGLYAANGGITISNGNTLNVGTSGNTSPSNFWGTSTFNSSIECKSIGNSSISNSAAYFIPSTTTTTGNNTYYFTSFARPSTTGSTTGSAYTVYIDGPPSGTITSPFSLFVNDGITRIGGTFRYSTGATTDYVLQSDSVGNASWVDVATLPSPTVTNYSVSTATTQDTTSSTPINIPSMSITPNSGTYFVFFNAVARILNNNRNVNVRLAKNGIAVPNTTSVYEFSGTNIDSAVICSSTISCNGTDIITAQFWVTSGSGTIRLTNQKIISAIRIGAA